MRPVPWTEVIIDDAFWSPRCETNRRRAVPHGFSMLRDKGYEENFKRASQRLEGGFQGLVYQDSDVYKLLQSAAALRDFTEFDQWVELIEAAQMDDGYVDTFFQLTKPTERWSNLRDCHEMYCAGHLIEAGVTDFIASGNSRLLDVSMRFADHICERFGPDKLPGYPGHPELELALIQLYRVTGDRKYFDLARHFIDARGSHYFAEEHDTQDYNGEYWQDRLPLAKLDALEGHAVRALYLMCAVTDIVAETGDEQLELMQRRVWQNLVERRTYVTGGVGSWAKNEGFTTDFDLPNETAYQETCASIAMVFWNHRMALLYRDAKYVDVMETALYNGVLSGISLDGTKFFYENPLASKGDHHRTEWFECACCPPNISRLLSMLGGYAYAVDENSLWINLFIGGSVEANTDGRLMSAKVVTDYPWSGSVEITPEGGTFTIFLRIPAWCDNFSLTVDGTVVDATQNSGYVELQEEWDGKKKVAINFDMPIRRIDPHPMVAANRGLVAIARGPMIYCFEPTLKEPLSKSFETSFNFELGAVVLKSDDVEAIPYAFWDNRDPASMAVWVPATFLQTIRFS